MTVTASTPITLPEDAAERNLADSQRVRIWSVRNFRDLGGYPSLLGGFVNRGLLYRSASLHTLSGRDHRLFSSLSIHSIIDFRSDPERQRQPDRLRADFGIRHVSIPILDSCTAKSGDLERQIRSGKVDDIDPAGLLTQANRELATRFTPQYRQFLHAVLDARGRPVLFHCAAGKDRTGFAAAILLRLLGVPEQLVMFDYLMSNRHYLRALRPVLKIVALVKGRKVASALTGFAEVRASFLEAAFQALTRQFGSFEAYAHDGLDLSEQDLRTLRSVYLQPPFPASLAYAQAQLENA